MPSKSFGAVPYVADYVNGEFPWEDPLWPASRPKRKWRHTVYVGVYDIESAWAVFGEESEEHYDGSPPGQSAALLLVVDEHGTLSLESATLSQCVWAAGRFSRRGLLEDVMHAFTADEADWKLQLSDLAAKLGVRVGDESSEGFPTSPLNALHLRRILDMTLSATAAGSFLTNRGEALNTVRIESREVGVSNSDELSATSFFNSFYFHDLLQISGKPLRGGATRQYLGLAPNSTAKRLDTRADLDLVYEAVSPDMVPDGRWPSNISHPLALSQQFAVNRVLADLGNKEATFAVNGPPGTGKTTMLRDIIAALVTRRAGALAAFDDPSCAFIDSQAFKTSDGRKHQVHPLHESLRGFEMILASSNNGAVENISLEIPVLRPDVIATNFATGFDYFSDIATNLLNAGSAGTGDEEGAPQKAWGLISAKLGKKANIDDFIGKCLFGDQSNASNAKPNPGFLPLLDQTPSQNAPSWNEARRSFLAAKSKVDRLRAERQQLHDAFRNVPHLRMETQKLVEVLRADTISAGRQHQIIRGWEASLKKLTNAEELIRTDTQTHLQARPGILEQVFTLGRVMAPWRQRQTDLAKNLDAIQSKVPVQEKGLEGARENMTRLETARQKTARQLEQREQQRASAEYLLQNYGGEAPAHDWFDPGSDSRELKSPWLDQEFNEARSELFLEALKLHQAFVLAQADKVRQNLLCVLNVLRRSTAPDTSPEAVRVAWESLFMIVPTVTTTFASVPRMFASLGDQQLGWLFIDEAGQATPQAALCGIWRAHRAVLVGDPLQLTPVVNLPPERLDRLRELTGTDSRWLPDTNPAQVLADRTASHGTYIRPAGGDRIWVGAPLKVHRRCDDPMFSAVNREVYDGLMLHGNESLLRRFPKQEDRPAAPASAWFDIATTTWSGHASKQELMRFKELLTVLAGAGYDMSEVLAVSPYRDTAAQLGRHATGLLPDPRSQTGTVHRAQGKEAQIVILVLGGQSAGAREWAVNTPNLFNVAVSRAKHRIYVIGSRTAWSRLPYFSALAPRLDHRPEASSLEDFFVATPDVPATDEEMAQLAQKPAGEKARLAPSSPPESGPDSVPYGGPNLVDDWGTPMSRQMYWGQRELGEELGITPKQVGDLLRETGLLLPGKEKVPSEHSMAEGLARWATVQTANGPVRYARWHGARTLQILKAAVD